ncbi:MULTISPECIES: hypothetical protein [unclassified Streptomyces]
MTRHDRLRAVADAAQHMLGEGDPCLVAVRTLMADEPMGLVT